MAILKNLIVNGASRFLQKAYFDDIAVSGTTTITNLNATTLDVSGKTTLNGATDINNTFNIKNTDHAINFYFMPTGSTFTSRIYESSPSTGVYQLNIQSNLDVKNNLSTSKLIVSDKSNFGGKVKIDGDVDIIGNLRWSTIAEHMTIQNLGGTLLVAPTIYQSNNITINVTAKTNNSVTFIITDSSMITGTTVDTTNNTFISGGANWRKNSLVKVSGKIGECVLGASDGTITNINISNYQMTITATIANATDIELRSYSANEISDFAVMLYKLHNGTSLFPIGIVLTSYGSDRKSYIDVYGGTDANPIARMGNLGGLKYNDYSDPSSTAGVDELANQWGFYTKGNAYFEGHIKTNAGIIGGWEITSDGLGRGTALGTSGSIYLIPAGKTTTNSIGGSNDTSILWTIASGNTFGVTTTGAMYCTSGKIGGWNITAAELSNGTFADANASSVYLIPAGSTATANIGGYGSAINGWVITSRNTFGVNANGGMYCTSGKIGGWNIADGQLSYAVNSTDTIGATGSAFLIPGGSTSTADIGGSGSISGWTFTSDSTFGVTNAGAMYCTSGKIGGMTIDYGGIYTGDPRNSETDNGVYIGNVGIRRTIGGNSLNGLKLAIGQQFGVNGSGKSWMKEVYAEKITAFKALRIKGVPAGGEKTPEENNGIGVSGISFDCIRANAEQLSTEPNLSSRRLSIGTNFFDSSEDTEYGGYMDIIPDCGITIYRHRYKNASEKTITTSSVTINAESITMQGMRDSNGDIVTDTNVGILGSLYVTTGISAFETLSGGSTVQPAIKYNDINGNQFQAIGSKAVDKDIAYILTTGHLYLLITWHNAENGLPNRGAWIFRGGSTFYMKLDTFHGTSGNSATSTSTGSGITITLTSTTVKFTTSASPYGCRLIDLG